MISNLHPEEPSSSSHLPSPRHDDHQQWNYGGNPLAQPMSHESQALGPFGGDFQPGLYKQVDRKRANPVPMGLSGFALTTFLLSIINLNVRGVSLPYIVVGPSLAYGGLIQLLAGMWEIAIGNAFGAFALGSYGGFWISLGIIFTPGGFHIAEAYGGAGAQFYTVLGLYLIGWFVFTVLVWLATLRATLIFNLLVLSVWLTFLLLGVAYIDNDGNPTAATPNATVSRAGGGTGIVASFLAWWVMVSGILDRTNSFVLVPIFQFPWAAKTGQGESDEEKQE